MRININRYHEKRAKNNMAVKKFRKDKSVKDVGKIKQLELVRILLRMMIQKMMRNMGLLHQKC